MSELPLALSFYADLDTGKLVSADGNTLILPDAKLGDTWLCKQRFLVHADDGTRERDLNVRGLKASIGNVMTPPTSGTFRLIGHAPGAATLTISADDAVPLTFAKTMYIEDTRGTIPPPVLVQETVAAGTFATMQESIDALQALNDNYTIVLNMDGSITVTAGADLVSPHHLIVTFKNLDSGTTTFEADSGSLVSKACPPLAWNATAEDFQTAAQQVIHAKTIAEVRKPADSTWLYRLTDDSEYDLTNGQNRLDPVSFIRIRAYQGPASEWWHEVRLIQAPVAFNAGWDRVLPSPPSITEIQAGRVATDSDPALNEIQALYVPPDFRGTFVVVWGTRISAIIGLPTSADEITTALNAMYTDSKVRFAATLPLDNTIYIEFIGDLEAAPHALATVTVKTHPPGVVTFALPLDRAEMASALRAVSTLTATLEVEVEYVADGEDPDDMGVPSRILTLFQQPVTLVREQNYAELAVVPPTDWLHPASPTTFLPFNGSQLLVGNRATHIQAFGNGTGRTFSIPHGRGTKNGNFSVRENMNGGLQMFPIDAVGPLYTVTHTSDNEITLTWNAGRTAPTTNQYVAMYEASGPQSAFQNDLHIAIAQVDDLVAALSAITGRLDTLEGYIPTAAPSLTDPLSAPLEYKIPDKAEAFPGKFADAFAAIPTPPLRARPLLPALHVAVDDIIALDTVYPPLPTASVAIGHVYQNDLGESVLLPGGYGQRSASVPDEGFFASDGRLLYPVTEDGGNNSFYATSFERRLFALAVNDKMLRAGSTLDVTFDLAARLLAANTKAEWVLKIDVGTVPQVSSPAPVGVNLSTIVWSTTPILKQRIVLSDLLETGTFGASIARSASSAYTAAALIYSQWESASGAPASANFLLRAWLGMFDTQDDVPAPTGAVWYALTNASWRITKS